MKTSINSSYTKIPTLKLMNICKNIKERLQLTHVDQELHKNKLMAKSCPIYLPIEIHSNP